MSLESVRRFFAEKAPDIAIIEAPVSTATVELAARAHGVAPGQIAKTLSLRVGEQVVLVVMRGDARLDNAKLKQAFGVKKAKMLDPESVQAVTGHPVGGVCPFGLATDIPVYCDQSLRDFEEVLPAAGDIHTAVRISPERPPARPQPSSWLSRRRRPSSSSMRARPGASPGACAARRWVRRIRRHWRNRCPTGWFLVRPGR